MRLISLPALLVLGALPTLVTAPASADTMEVGAGQAVRVDGGRGLSQVVVGDPSIADVNVDKTGHVMVFGKRAGSTTLTLVGRGGQVVRDDVVVVRAGGAATVTVTYGTGKSVPPGGVSVIHACGEGCSPVAPEQAKH